MSGMKNLVDATLALDGLPLGSLIVACGVEDDGTAYGILYRHVEVEGARTWLDLTRGGTSPATAITETYDDMVIAGLGDWLTAEQVSR